MASGRARIRTGIWGDGEWTSLSVRAQLVGLFLMAGKGRGPWPVARVVRKTGYSATFVQEAFDELSQGAYARLIDLAPKRRRMSARLARIVKERDGWVCLHCGARDRLTIDHIWPVSRGGADDLDNLQTLCHSCNAKKGARVDGLVQG